MVITHNLADDFGGLAVGTVVHQTHLVHAVENATMHRLEAIPYVRQGSPHDDAHGVIEVRGVHLVFDGDVA